MAILYTATAEATGDGRGGHARSSDGVLDLDLSVPKDMGGAGGEGTNPEQLFAAGYAACFHGALLVVGRTEKVELSDTTVTAAVSIGKDDAGFGLSVKISAHLPGIPADRARTLVEQAHQVCPYSKATRGNIEVEVTAV